MLKAAVFIYVENLLNMSFFMLNLSSNRKIKKSAYCRKSKICKSLCEKQTFVSSFYKLFYTKKRKYPPITWRVLPYKKLMNFLFTGDEYTNIFIDKCVTIPLIWCVNFVNIICLFCKLAFSYFPYKSYHAIIKNTKI